MARGLAKKKMKKAKFKIVDGCVLVGLDEIPESWRDDSLRPIFIGQGDIGGWAVFLDGQPDADCRKSYWYSPSVPEAIPLTYKRGYFSSDELGETLRIGLGETAVEIWKEYESPDWRTLHAARWNCAV